MQHICKHLAISGCLLALAACGGGSSSLSSISWPVDPDAARSLTDGSAPPDMTSNQIEGRLDALQGGADSLLLSDFLVFTDTGSRDRIEMSCSGSTCVGTYRGQSVQFRLLDSSNVVVDGEYQAVMTRHGIPLAQGRGRDRDSVTDQDIDIRVYGGWLDHGYFFVGGGILENREIGLVLGEAVGNAPDTNPTGSGSATWTGVMIGVDVSLTETIGDVIQGDAAITIPDLSSPRIGVEFTNIYNLDTRRSRTDMTWDGIALNNGSFETGSDGNSIEGRFYGPNHEEVGGIFERDEVIGAFGAKRQ